MSVKVCLQRIKYHYRQKSSIFAAFCFAIYKIIIKIYIYNSPKRE